MLGNSALLSHMATAFIPSPVGTVRCVIHQNAGGLSWTNALYVGPSASSVIDFATLQSIANAMGTGWKNTVLQDQSPNVFFDYVEAFDASTNSAPSAISTTATGHGGDSNSQLPSQVAGLVQLLTSDLGGRASHGKLYVGGLTTNSIDGNGHPTTGWRGTAAAYLNGWNTALAAVTIGFNVVYMRFHRDGAVLSPGEPHDVSSTNAASLMSTQDRRKG